jgi:hypothetical protein
VTTALSVQFGVIPRSCNPFDVLRKYKLDSGTDSHGKTRYVACRTLPEHLEDPFGDANLGFRIPNLPGTLHGDVESLVVHGLKEIIQSVHLESPQCMLLVSGKKDYRRQVLFRQGSKNLKAVHAGHLHIEKDDVRSKLKDLLDCRRAVVAFSDDLHIFKFF